MLPWLIGLVAVVLVTGGAAVVGLWASGDWNSQANAFYSAQTGTDPLPEAVYRKWDRLQQNAYLLQNIATPLLLACVVALLAFIAVLARRWDVTHRRALALEGAAPQAEATAAS
jgi:TRAP-type C4-dicarboxylate transport system permease small subunit